MRIRASNVLITDYIPRDSDYVSANLVPSSIDTDTNGSFLTWKIATLDPGQQQDITVMFKKLDLPNQCGALYNAVLSATSDEYLILSERFNINGDTNYAYVPVQTPLEIVGFSQTPEPVYFGGLVDVTLTVRSYWPKAINAMTLSYDIQSNARFVTSSSNVPTPKTAPSGATPGGKITWEFDMLAGSIAAPVDKKFTFRLRGGYENGYGGLAALQVPSTVPSACLQPLGKAVGFQERIVYSKMTDADPQTRLQSAYLVTRGQEFPYYDSDSESRHDDG